MFTKALPPWRVLPAVLSLALAVGAQSATAAESRPNRVGAGLGAGNLQLNDELVRGLRWNGFGGELKLFFDRQAGEDLWRANLRLPVALVKNRYGHQGLSWDVQADAGWAHRLATAGDVEVSLGARLRWDLSVAYYVDFDEEHLYWLNSYEVSPLVVVGWRLTPTQRLGAELDAAVVTLASRPPEHRYYKIDKLTHPSFFFTKTHEAMRLTGLSDHLAARLRLVHEARLSERVSLKTVYALDYAWHADPRPVQVLMHSISTGVAYVF